VTPTPNSSVATPEVAVVPPANASSLPARPSTLATLKPPVTGNVKPSTSSANTSTVLPNARGSDAPIVVPVLKTAPMPNLSTPPTAPVNTSTVVDTSSSSAVEQPLPEASTETPELFYTVVTGETLYRIALRYNVTIESIRAVNNLSSDTISAGQRIKIPVPRTATLVPSSSSSQQGVSEVSQRYLGVTYRFGGTNANGLDCSGFVQIVFAEMGLKLPRTSALQFQAGIEVAREDLIQGDLVFFDTTGRGVSHVGIYLKDNQFIHAASNPGKVTISSLSEKYWQPKYLGARRVLTDD
jgi:peptidoglycan DL-endopeptidase LytE